MSEEPVFKGNFTQQDDIPAESIKAALSVLGHARLHRYNLEHPDEVSEAAALECEFAAFTGAQYALAVASGGYAMACALRAIGVTAGDKVLSNGFTLAPVPGAIASVGAVPVFVEMTENLVIDPDDLRAKLAASGARVLLLSHMRGHLCDMDQICDICHEAQVQIVEDCAHTMGASWRGVASGRHGVIGCYSSQSYKHINSGEGGLLVSDDAEAMARAILLSGSYMLYERHLAAPPAQVFERIKWETPNISGRMDNLRAAILRPQLQDLPRKIAAWNARYETIERALKNAPGLRLIARDPRGAYVGSSIQFCLPQASASQMNDLVERCALRGVELKWFGAPVPKGFTSRHDSWRFVQPASLPRTDGILAGLLDMRIPLTFTLEDCAMIARIIRSELARIFEQDL